MRAVRAESFTGYGGLKLVEVPRPRRAGGRVLVRITAAGVTPLDHTILSGEFPRATAPLILGNEGAGVVEDPGDSVFSEGARVMFTGPYGVAEDGTYSEWIAVRDEDLCIILLHSAWRELVRAPSPQIPPQAARYRRDPPPVPKERNSCGDERPPRELCRAPPAAVACQRRSRRA